MRIVSADAAEANANIEAERSKALFMRGDPH